jgi:hypothetical protein
MKTQMAAGPSIDVEFFAKLQALFDEYPHVGQRYSVAVLCDEIGGVPIDYSTQHAVSRVQGNRIVTEVRDNPKVKPNRKFHACCEWRYYDGRWRCIRQCLE